jgi:hypothetical protein
LSPSSDFAEPQDIYTTFLDKLIPMISSAIDDDILPKSLSLIILTRAIMKKYCYDNTL